MRHTGGALHLGFVTKRVTRETNHWQNAFSSAFESQKLSRFLPGYIWAVLYQPFWKSLFAK